MSNTFNDAFFSQDGSYRGRADPWYGRYDGQTPAYRDPNYQYRESQSERPSSRASQYSDRPSSRSVILPPNYMGVLQVTVHLFVSFLIKRRLRCSEAIQHVFSFIKFLFG